MLVGLMATLLPYIGAAAGTLLVVAGWTWFSLYSFQHGVWFNMAQPLLGCVVALFAGTAYQYFVEGAEKRVVKKLFGRYVSRMSTISCSRTPSSPSLEGNAGR